MMNQITIGIIGKLPRRANYAALTNDLLWLNCKVIFPQLVNSFSQQYAEKLLELRNTDDLDAPQQLAIIVFPYNDSIIGRFIYIRLGRYFPISCDREFFNIHTLEDTHLDGFIWTHSKVISFPEPDDVDPLITHQISYTRSLTKFHYFDDATQSMKFSADYGSLPNTQIPVTNIMNLSDSNFSFDLASLVLTRNFTPPAIRCYVDYVSKTFVPERMREFADKIRDQDAHVTYRVLEDELSFLQKDKPNQETLLKREEETPAPRAPPPEVISPLPVSPTTMPGLFGIPEMKISDKLFSYLSNATFYAVAVPDTITELYEMITQTAKECLNGRQFVEDFADRMHEPDLLDDLNQLLPKLVDGKFEFPELIEVLVSIHTPTQVNNYIRGSTHRCHIPGPCLLNTLRERDHRERAGVRCTRLLNEITKRYFCETIVPSERPFAALRFLKHIALISTVRQLLQSDSFPEEPTML